MSKNKFTGIKVEFHILQSFPTTCLNRDDVGSPKSAVVGGVKRARVSSQCWKRVVRMMLHEMGITLAVRTKHLEEIISGNFSEDEKKAYADKIALVCKALSDDTLVFFSEAEGKAMAEFIKTMTDDSLEKSKDGKVVGLSKAAMKELCKLIKDSGVDGIDGLDTALFGRMIAKAPILDIEAAASFAHAITTHKVNSEIDYFTAVDDLADEENGGAAHLGTSEFNSGTFYRYVSINLGMLYDFFGNEEDMLTAVAAFTRALYIAVPQARQKTQAGYCPWNYAHVYIRKGQEMQLSFEEPVKASGDGYLKPSIEKMEADLKHNEHLMGSMFGKVDEYIYGDSDEHGIDQLVEKLCKDIKAVSE